MKVLFFHIPNLGMYHSIEPLLLELQARGHEVIHYNEGGFGQYLQDTTIFFTPYSHYQGYFPSRCSSTMGLYDFGLLLLETAEHMIDTVEAEVLRQSPDLILHSRFMAAPKAIASREGIPAVCLTDFVFHPRMVLEEERKKRTRVDLSNISSMLEFRKRAKNFYDKHADGCSDINDIFVNDERLNLILGLEAFQQAPSSLSCNWRFVGPTIWIDGYSKSYEVIYASLGSVFLDNNPFYETCIRALGSFANPAIISLGGRLSPEEFDSVPSNVQLCRFVCQRDVLQKAAVFITHGGHNSVAEAIYCATPMIVVPQIPEQLIRAQQVQRMMLGKYINPGELSVALLRSLVAEVLDNPIFRDNVQALKDTLPKIPPAITACDQIEAFILEHSRCANAS